MEPISWKQTRKRLGEDRLRLREYHFLRDGYHPWIMFFSLNYQCVFLQRISFFFFQKGFYLTARFFWHLNLLLTGVDISPITDIGGGFVIESPVGSAIAAKIGRNCWLRGHCSIGGGMSDRSDVGAGPGLPVIGNDVEVGHRTVILGPVTIGDRSRLGPGCLVLHDIPEDSVLTPPEPQYTIRKKTDPQ